MPLQATSGAASYDAFGGGVPAVPNYIEDVFSTFLRVSDGTNTQAIVNNIDLSTKGGLVWSKPRAAAGENHILVDSARGVNKYLSSDLTSAQGTMGTPYVFNTNGFTSANGNFWANGVSLVDWTFRKQPKFFDVVTFSGTGSAQTIAHNLGSVPGCIIVKNLDAATNWAVYHRSLGGTYLTRLNRDWAAETGYENWANTDPTSTVFTVGNGNATNGSGYNYVAYVFAHNAGGFGLTGTDNVISCGSFDANNGEVINLGYEPQWLFYKDTVSADNWRIADTMRGLTNLSGTNAYTIQQLMPNSTAVESANSGPVLTSTGFTWNQSGGGNKHIYIAIRRGPMKVPTSGTSVFLPSTAPATTPFNVGFPPDLALWSVRDSTGNKEASTRLQGGSELFTNTTGAESSGYDIGWASKTNFWYQNVTGGSMINWMFRRAPSFCDVVCYTGNGSTQNVSHNLGAVPELMIVKSRSLSDSDWWVYASALTTPQNKYLRLQSTDGESTATGLWGSSLPTSTTFGLGAFAPNSNGATFVAYLFATCAGVSKCTSFTGNGTSQTINCGFTGGARFVLIKRTDSTGNWVTFDTARGIVSGNDPALYLNSTAAEVTGVDAIDPDSTGFIVNQESTFNLNVSSATYLVLAIA